MANMIRWDPYRDMMSLQRVMDRMVEEAMGSEGNRIESYRWELPLDVIEKEDAYIVKASLPGIHPDDLEITYNQGTLTIQAESRADDEQKNERYLVRERRYGKFMRSISLPNLVNANNIAASYDAGILTLRLPKAEEVKPRRIQIQIGEPKTIEPGSGKN